MRPIVIAGVALAACVSAVFISTGAASAQTTPPATGTAPAPPAVAAPPPAPSSAPTPAAPAAAAVDDKPDKPICHYVEEVGTAVRKKICH
jgi:hypothetical protein